MTQKVFCREHVVALTAVICTATDWNTSRFTIDDSQVEDHTARPPQDCFILRTDGSIEGPVDWTYETITRIEAQPIDEERLVIRGGVVGETTVGQPYRDFPSVEGCADVTLRACFVTGHRIYTTIGRAGKPFSMGSYDVQANRVVNLPLVGCRMNHICDRTRVSPSPRLHPVERACGCGRSLVSKFRLRQSTPIHRSRFLHNTAPSCI